MHRAHTSTALCRRNMLASEVTDWNEESEPVGGGGAYGKVRPGGGVSRFQSAVGWLAG